MGSVHSRGGAARVSPHGSTARSIDGGVNESPRVARPPSGGRHDRAGHRRARACCDGRAGRASDGRLDHGRHRRRADLGRPGLRLRLRLRLRHVQHHGAAARVLRERHGSSAPASPSDWTVSEDGLTYTLTIREGVNFHDGTPMTDGRRRLQPEPDPRPGARLLRRLDARQRGRHPGADGQTVDDHDEPAGCLDGVRARIDGCARREARRSSRSTAQTTAPRRSARSAPARSSSSSGSAATTRRWPATTTTGTRRAADRTSTRSSSSSCPSRRPAWPALIRARSTTSSRRAHRTSSRPSRRWRTST